MGGFGIAAMPYSNLNTAVGKAGKKIDHSGQRGKRRVGETSRRLSPRV
jgi:hypothetical protein